ncbi:hypothetical protein F4810DRAFT_705322 [Camillea tinctor]|nr:hypothetical protein F4810DRAFT_705322 [Camillea tinctor]
MAPRTREIFRNCDIALAGTLEIHESYSSWTVAAVERWVTAWGGTFSHRLDAGVTHLLATEAQVRERAPRVVEVLQKNKKKKGGRQKGEDGVCIVNPDWLEDSISKRRRLKEANYEVSGKSKEDEERMRSEKRRRGEELAVKGVDPNYNHVYRDETFFEYEILLTRKDEESGNVEKHVLTLWESNAWPHLYHFVAKFLKRPRGEPHYYRPSDSPRLLETEFKEFKKYFRQRTGLLWDDRLRRAGTEPTRFQYQPPTGGKPVGLIAGRAVSPSQAVAKRRRSCSPAKKPRLSTAARNGEHDKSKEAEDRQNLVNRAIEALASPPPSPSHCPNDLNAQGASDREKKNKEEEEEEP